MQDRLDSIQILRACAALVVVFAHLWPTLLAFGVSDAIPNFLFGASGVDLFFVISGFIMVYTSEKIFGTPGAPLRFLGRRLLRIVPLYWAMTTILIIADHSRAGSSSIQHLLSSYFFIPVQHPPTGSTEPFLGVGWSLNFEMFFYVCFAAAVAMSRRSAVVVLSIWLLAFTIAGSYFSFMKSAPLSVWSEPFLYEFSFGVWIALIYREGLRIPIIVSVVLIASGLALMTYTYYVANFTAPPNYLHDSWLPRFIGWGGGAAIIVAGTTLCDSTRRVPAFLLPLVSLGDASYALYLVHTVTPTAFTEVLRRAPILSRAPFFQPQVHAWLYCVVLTLTSIVAAIILNRFDARLRERIQQASTKLARVGVFKTFATNPATSQNSHRSAAPHRA